MRQIDGVIFEAIYYDVVRTSSARRMRIVRQHLRSRCCYISLRKQSVGVNESLSRKLTMTNSEG